MDSDQRLSIKEGRNRQACAVTHSIEFRKEIHIGPGILGFPTKDPEECGRIFFYGVMTAPLMSVGPGF